MSSTTQKYAVDIEAVATLTWTGRVYVEAASMVAAREAAREQFNPEAAAKYLTEGVQQEPIADSELEVALHVWSIEE